MMFDRLITGLTDCRRIMKDAHVQNGASYQADRRIRVFTRPVYCLSRFKGLTPNGGHSLVGTSLEERYAMSHITAPNV